VFAAPLLIALLASSQITEDDKLTVTSHAFGKTIKSTIEMDGEAFSKTPEWDSERTDIPPISPRKAIRLARRMRDSVVTEEDGWEWHTTALLLFIANKNCAYHVTFQAINPSRLEAGLRPLYQEVTLIVMMDGTVIKPVVTEDKDYHPDELPPKPAAE